MLRADVFSASFPAIPYGNFVCPKRHIVKFVIYSLISYSLQVFAGEPVVVGVLAFRSFAQTARRWQPTVEYLAREIPDRRFELQVMDQADIHAALLAGQVDFLLTNPEAFILDRRVRALSPLATLVSEAGGQPVSQMGGVIFRKKGRTDLTDLSELRGKVLAAPSHESMGGYLTQHVELERAGVNLRRGEATLLFTGMPHDRVVAAVLNEQADAGFVRTGVIEDMVRDGTLDLNQVEVMHAQTHPAFPLLRSTALYPEWPWLATGRPDGDLVKQVSMALMRIDRASPMARAGQYFGFAAPADYSVIDALMQQSRLYPGQLEQFDSRDIFEKYSRQVEAGLSILLLLVTALAAYFVRLYRAGTRERSNRMAFEAALSTSETRFRKVFECAALGIARVSLGGGWIEVNQKLLDILGYEREALLGKTFQEITHPDDLNHDLELVEQMLSGRLNQYSMEKRYRHQLGHYFWARLTVSLVRSVAGQPEYFISVVEDIQNLKNAELALERSRHDLEVMATHQVAILEKERSRLSRELHDELGQMLTGLNLHLATLSRQSVSDMPRSINAAVEMVTVIARAVRTLAHQLRPPQLDNLGLVSSINWHLKQIGALSPVRVDFSTRLSQERFPPAIELAAFRIFQEALTNALRHSAASEIEVCLAESDGQLTLSILDNGQGFDVAEQVNPPWREKDFRLGLLGMRERAQTCAGHLDIVTKPGRGTQVLVRFELAKVEWHD